MFGSGGGGGGGGGGAHLPDIQARPAERAAPLHTSHAQSQLSRLDGGHITPWTTANDDDVLLHGRRAGGA